MATQTYGTGANSSQGANTIVHYYDRAGIKAANRVNVYGQWADRKSMPKKMGKTFKISKFLHMYDRALSDGDFGTKGYMTGRDLDTLQATLAATDGSGVSLLEGAGSTNQRTLEKVTVEASLARYGEMLEYSDEVELFSEDAMQVRYREELGELANSRYEDLIQLDLLSTTTKMYSGTATSMVTLGDSVALDGTEDADWKASYDLVRKAVRKLTRNRAKKNTKIVSGSTKIDTKTIDKAYYAIIDADVKSDLESLIRGSGAETEYVYVPFHKYAAASSMVEGEVGAMHEVRFIESESALVEYQKGATVPTGYVGNLAYTGVIASGAKFDVHPILFPTEGSFATVGLKGMNRINFNSKGPKDIDLTNPYGTKGFFSYNFFYATVILEAEKLLRLDVLAGK
jgi:N4-gp56 family major capsid protein